MPLSIPFNESKILELLAAGSEQSFSLIFNKYYDKVCNMALSLLKSSIWAEEIAQEVFIKVWLKRGEFSAVKHFEAYLLSMTRNLSLDKFKKISCEANALKAFSQSVSADVNATDHLLRSREYELLLRAALNRLTPQQKLIYYLSREQGLSQKMIAIQLKVSRLTIKKHMAMALQSIRQELASHINFSILVALSFIL